MGSRIKIHTEQTPTKRDRQNEFHPLITTTKENEIHPQTNELQQQRFHP